VFRQRWSPAARSKGREKAQGLTGVLLRYLSRTGMAGERDLDKDPRRRRRGRRRQRCSGGERRQQTCARASVRHGERVGTINWKKTCWIRGDRRRQRRRRRGRTPASVGEAQWWTRESLDGSGSFTGMMWCWLGYRGGVERLRASCPR
jgi:hypothetical protein